MIRFKRTLWFGDGEEISETLEIKNESDLQKIMSYANTCKTAFLNDIQLTKDGILDMRVRNRSLDLIEYLNGEVNEFWPSVAS